MRKDSLVILVTSIVLTLGIVGSAHYLYLQDLKKVPGEVTVKPPSDIATGKSYLPPTQPAIRRTDTAIKCKKSDGTVFYTNATRCKDADLNNRISIADPVKPVPRVRVNDSSQKHAKTNKKRLKSIPWKMNNACSFAIGKAQQIEKKSLRLKDDPSESLWKNSYCRWVCEARAEKCEDIKDYLGMTRLCPNRYYPDKSYCNN